MKKVIITLPLTLITALAFSQAVTLSAKVSVLNALIKDEDTRKTLRDREGVLHKVYITQAGKMYIKRTNKKGKDYIYFLRLRNKGQ